MPKIKIEQLNELVLTETEAKLGKRHPNPIRVSGLLHDSSRNPGTDPHDETRYIVSTSGAIHGNFGNIDNLGINDIIVYNSGISKWQVDYDSSEYGLGAIAYNQDRNNLWVLNSSGVLPTWSESSVGSQGDVGPQGNKGSTGDLGPQGPVGDQGPVGPQGGQGPVGIQGPVGDQGPVGGQGPVGPQGDQGPVGTQGSDGGQGPAGPQGDQGPVGTQGADGDQGPVGTQGDQGPVGTQGADGDQGPVGTQGNVGDEGATGTQGPDGNTGPAGPLVSWSVDNGLTDGEYNSFITSGNPSSDGEWSMHSSSANLTSLDDPTLKFLKLMVADKDGTNQWTSGTNINSRLPIPSYVWIKNNDNQANHFAIAKVITKNLSSTIVTLTIEWKYGLGSISAGNTLLLMAAPTGDFLPLIKYMDMGKNVPFYHLTAVTANSASINIDLVEGGIRQKVSCTYTGGNITANISKDPPGPCHVLLKITCDNASIRRINAWTTSSAANIYWPKGNVPQMSSGNGDVDLVSFFFDGTDYYGIANFDFQ